MQTRIQAAYTTMQVSPTRNTADDEDDDLAAAATIVLSALNEKIKYGPVTSSNAVFHSRD